MRALRRLDEVHFHGSASAVTVGNFDGVHLGHQGVIDSAVRGAAERGVISIVCTFEPHTAEVLQSRRTRRLLQTPRQRLAAIEALGADVAVVIPFDTQFASTSRESFVEDFLQGRLGAASLHLSEGFMFGRGGAGTVDYLLEVAPRHGFDLTVVPPVLVGGEKVSSTRVRETVTAGRVVDAARLLGRPFALMGLVVEGSGIGRELAAPTANLAYENGCLPGPGVYVTETVLDGIAHGAVTNVGYRPTFGRADGVVVETHLLDYSGSLYGRTMEVAFLERLRDEERFDTAAELSEQIAADIRRAREFFDTCGGRDSVSDG